MLQGRTLGIRLPLRRVDVGRDLERGYLNTLWLSGQVLSV